MFTLFCVLGLLIASSAAAQESQESAPATAVSGTEGASGASRSDMSAGVDQPELADSIDEPARPLEVPSGSELEPRATPNDPLALDLSLLDPLSEAQYLHSRSKRQRAGAIAGYAAGAALVGVGVWSLVMPCKESPDNFFGAGFCEDMRVAAGVTSMGFSLVPILGIGMPFHRASSHNGRAARALQSGELLDFSRAAHRGQRMQGAGKTSFYVAGALLLSAGTSWAVTATVDGRSPREERSFMIASYSTAASAASFIIASSLFFRGRSLQENAARDTGMQAIITPVFYHDGAGAQLFLGF